MKNILVPVDFSEFSEYAIQVAAKIAKKQKANLTVLHMLGLSEATLAKNEIQEFEEAKYYMSLAKEKFRAFLDKSYLKDITVHEIIQNYKIFSELNNVAKEQLIDLIVMGSHGSSGLSDFFVGSNAEKVVRSSDIPVLVVKKPEQEFKIDTILFACGLDDEGILAYRKAKVFANKFEAQLKPIYINVPYERFLSTSEIEEHIARFMFKVGEPEQEVIIYNDYSIEKGLFNYSKKANIDIIAIPTHGRKGLSHFFMGSIGEDVANHANLPVLTLKIK